MTIRIGETGLAFYEAYNPTDRPVAGQATYNVTPDAAGYYFTKIACFCFTEQVLQPGERVSMPVTFFVDPEIVQDREGNLVQEITLSYTFHEIALPQTQAALAPAPSKPIN
jgi:cytochrome c oxidase assembly protein subunit 11